MIFNRGQVLYVSAAAVVLAACAPTGSALAAGARGDAAGPGAAAPTADALLALERRANEAYSQGDGNFFESLLSDKLVMQQGGSRLSKADVVKVISGVRCDVEDGWSLTDPQMSRIDNDTYALSYVITVDGNCTADGRTDRLPSPVRAATVWARNGDEWQVVFHGENLIVDPSAPPATGGSGEPAEEAVSAASAGEAAAPPQADPITDALMAVEHEAWEAWMAHDAGRIDALTIADMSFVNIFGTYLPNKAVAIREWTSTACEVNGFTLTHGVATSVSPTVGILTVTGSAEGTCGEQDISGQEIYATTVYVKDGEAWKWAFGFNSPE
jgi:hypothetical protein